jgi:enterochelin esterase-like enzyme
MRSSKPPRRGPRSLVAVVAVLTALTVVNLGVSATWWARSTAADPGAAVSVAPSAPVTSAPAAAPTAAPPSDDGIPAAEAPAATRAPATADLASTWTAPAAMPTRGRLLRVEIPGTASHFRARPALLWLPPAALVADPPALPVDVVMSGQSKGAGPEDVEDAGHIAAMMDALALTNRGLAPIVVVPDQLGPDSANPMCVDGPLGNSRTYLEEDVPAWITAHLRVQTGPSAWTVGGFSQGGTCAIQLGAGDPGRFGNLVDVSGQPAPSIGPLPVTIRQGFSGDAAAYRAAVPAAVLAAHGPYRASNAFFAVGQDDHEYGPVMPVMAAHARAAGMHVSTWVVPGERHDWTTARAGLTAGIAWLLPQTGLAPR